MKLVGVTAVAALTGAAAMGQLTERPLPGGALNHPAIGYYSRATSDPVAALGRRIADGTATLTFDEGSGYLRSALQALNVPVESQMLVMSKTGVQGLHTGPSNPRAIYFTDAITIGYIHGAPLLEFAVHDPQQGVVFYTLDQKPQAPPVFERPPSCLRCHQVYSTLHVPGMIVRSSFIAPDGLPLGQFGTYEQDDRTPFGRRWGGWYVTGTHGSLRHMGNAIVTTRDDPEKSISDATLNRTSLDGLFDARTYPSAHSDIVALMVFEHQSHMTNLITRAGWEARMDALTKDTIDELADYMLFVNEEPLTAQITGTSRFAEIFSARGPFDRRGRSLRQLDLERRLLKYRCSYMIYSAAFQALPLDVRRAVYRRAREVLSARDDTAVLEILAETVPEFAQ